MHVKVILYKSKTLKNGKHPVMLRITKNRKPKYISTGYSFDIKDWNEKENLPHKNVPNYKEIKISISDKINAAEKLILNADNSNKPISSEQVIKKVYKKDNNSYNVISYFDDVINRLIESGRIGNSIAYKDSRNAILKFTKGKDIAFCDLNISFLNKFEEYLIGKSLSRSTISVYFRTLRALINKAVAEDITSSENYHFRKFNFSNYNNIETTKRFVKKDELDKIKTLELNPALNIYNSRNLFMFSYYLRGMTFTDMAFLKWKQIKNNRLEYVRRKTGGHFNIELLSPALEILEHYKTTSTSEESFVFPILNESLKEPLKINNRIKNALKQFNKDLKSIAEKINYGEKITSYMARHSQAMVLKNNGVSVTSISEIMGHSSEKVTNVYLEKLDNSTLDNACKVLL